MARTKGCLHAHTKTLWTDDITTLPTKRECQECGKLLDVKLAGYSPLKRDEVTDEVSDT